ncbi:MAG: hypothetical protein KTR26_07360 [Flammeovirgaceae bacterium]|nr:hypothetical protein [Flammeovirgaceae bacterium]
MNIMARGEDDKLETWLGALVKPEEKFYVIVSSVKDKNKIVDRIAKIGYETQIIAVCTMSTGIFESSEVLDFEKFNNGIEQYTILDVRNESEVSEGKLFKNAINIPLNDLRNSKNEIPTDKPIVVHCAGGYRSAVGSSIIENIFDKINVFDLGENINNLKK